MQKVDQRVQPYAATNAAECSQSRARHEGEVRVENTATFWVVRGGEEMLDDILESVKYGQF